MYILYIYIYTFCPISQEVKTTNYQAMRFGVPSPRLFHKKSKWSIYLDQQSEILCSLYYCKKRYWTKRDIGQYIYCNY